MNLKILTLQKMQELTFWVQESCYGEMQPDLNLNQIITTFARQHFHCISLGNIFINYN